MLSKQIEKAQKKVEEQNFLIRKRVLEYDDVMNEQRRIVYAYRDQVLEGREMGDTAREELERVVRRIVDEYTPGDYLEDWDLEGLAGAIDALWPLELDLAALGKQQGVDREELIRLLHEDAVARYDAREEELGEELMRSLERYLLLDIIDTSGASTCTTWTTCARASTSAGSPRSSRSSRTRTRRTTSSPT
jgi:preprotein translocase subunit SecA